MVVGLIHQVFGAFVMEQRTIETIDNNRISPK